MAFRHKPATVIHVEGLDVHPGPGHGEKHMAMVVHRKFNQAVERQLSDGAYA